MKKKGEVNRARTLVGAGEGRREDLLLEQRPERALLREVRQRQRPVQPVPQLQDPLPLLHGRLPAAPGKNPSSCSPTHPHHPKP